MKTIAIIGAGQLGSRHLQALSKLEGNVSIQVIDSNKTSLEVAEQRFREVAEAFKGTVSYFPDIDKLSDDLDVVIVATGSNVRKEVTVELLNSKRVKYLILEKFLFPRLEEYQLVSDLLTQGKTRAWVNCPRRMFSFYKGLKGKLSNEVRMSATGNGWGLACNGIHLLDLFSFITGSTDITLSNKLLNKGIVQSKRPGYIEVTGTIMGISENHSIELTCFSTEASPVTMTIADENNRYIIHEGQVSTVQHSSRQNQWKWETFTFDLLFQSQLTHLVIDDLLNRGTCELTPYSESAQMHHAFLSVINDHVKRTCPEVKECLIT